MLLEHIAEKIYSIGFGICSIYHMANDTIRFTLSDNTLVIIKKVTNIKYDFELTFSNGSRKTFLWFVDITNEFSDRKGNIDKRITESIQHFLAL
jgi:hypothetical protein